MEHKLTDITPSFHSFAKDQVLTEKQLNEFLDYFDEQDRLSRICLSGVGIVCGFEVTTDETTKHITISKGAGITTDGDLVHFQRSVTASNGKVTTVLAEGMRFTHFRTYGGEKVNYDPQFDTVGGSPFHIIPLDELIPEGESTAGATPLSAIASLETKVVLLYLESYEKEQDNCVGVDCENQGIEQVNKLKVLLVDQTNIGRVLGPDNLFQAQTAVEMYLDQRNVHVPRVILSKDNSVSAPALASLYYADKLAPTIQPLRTGLNALLAEDKYSLVRNVVTNAIDEIFSAKYDSLVFFQYRYDFLKDLVDSYNELKKAYLNRRNFCCPNINAFPKHLMLGNPLAKKFKQQDNGYINQYRHSFFKSPILESNNSDEEFELIVKRIEALCATYRRRRYFDADLLKITPSNVRVSIGQRAIPFYYSYSDQLMRNWDFNRRKYNQHLSILGYAQGINNPTNLPISEPLNYSIDPYNFFRIEGHQGLSYEDALKSILDEKAKYSLPFDVKVLGISVEELDGLLSDQYKCAYRDLEVLLNAWASEQECIASEVAYILSSFSTKTQGKNLVEANFYQIKKPTKRVPLDEIAVTDEFNAIVTHEDTVNPVKTFRVTTTDNTSDSDKSIDGIRDVAPVKEVRPANNVEAFINNDVDSLGFLINDSITQANGNFDSAFAIALNNADVAVSEWDNVIAVSTIKLPLKIVFSVTKLANLIPNRIEDLSDSTLEDYNAEIAKLCSYTKQLQNQYRSNNELFVSKVTADTRGMVALLINQLTTICCSAKKLQSLLQEVEDRKESVLGRLDFTRFVDSNPGLEHKAGVEPGQTFVMVYVNRAIKIRMKDEFFISEVDNVDELPSRRRAAQIIPRGTVIADFTLPYMCCSDCESVNFVLPKIPVELTLSADAYCIDDSNLELEFTVVPDDGIITVVDAIPGVEIENNTLRIDGALFPAERLGTKIKFKVNSEKTDLELLVSKRPEVEIVTTIAGGSRNVNFSIIGDYQPDYLYAWNFGDGNSSTERNPTHQYTLTEEDETFNVSLTVTPGAGICPTVETTELQFEGVSISIAPGPYCQNDQPIDFVISPEGATPKIIGAGVSDDYKQFIPSDAGPGTHELFFNDKLIQTITVTPTVSVVGEIVMNEFDDKLNLSVSASNVTNYKWILTLPNGTELTFAEAEVGVPLTAFSSLKSGDIVEILLEISNGCGSETLSTDYIMPDVEDPSATIPTKKFCVERTKKVDFITANFTANTILAIDGVAVTTDPLSFIPANFSLGMHEVSIDGVVQYSFSIGKKPGGYIDTSLGADSYLFDFVPDSNVLIDSMVWSFYEDGNEMAGPIRPEIIGKTSISVPYDSFSSKEWDKLKVYLTMANGCGETEISTAVDAPVRSVTVTLPGNIYTYCSDDDGPYKFIFSPDTGKTTLIGDGVTGTSFSPKNLSEGNHTIVVSDGPDLTIRIVNPRVGAPEVPVYDAQNGTLMFNFVPRASAPKFKLTWEVYRSTPGDIPGATSTELNYLLKLDELGIKEGETLKITVSIDVDPCGLSTTTATYTVPTKEIRDNTEIIDPKECEQLFVEKYTELHASLPTPQEQEFLTVTQKEKVTDLRKILEFGMNNANDVISGTENDVLFGQFMNLLADLKKAALSAQGSNINRFNVLMKLYQMVLMAYANALRCQDTVKVGGALSDLSALLSLHFDTGNASSFPTLQINVLITKGENELNGILSKRNLAVEPWRSLNQVVLNDVK